MALVLVMNGLLGIVQLLHKAVVEGDAVLLHGHAEPRLQPDSARAKQQQQRQREWLPTSTMAGVRAGATACLRAHLQLAANVAACMTGGAHEQRPCRPAPQCSALRCAR